jgi:ribonuclease J
MVLSMTLSVYRNDPAVNFAYAHTSGHAMIRDLERLAEALKPDMRIPIHTEHPEDFSQTFANIITLNDGEVFDLA